MKCDSIYCFKEVENISTLKFNKQYKDDYGNSLWRQNYNLCDECFKLAIYRIKFLFGDNATEAETVQASE